MTAPATIDDTPPVPKRSELPRLPVLWLRFTNLFRRRKKAYLHTVPEVTVTDDGEFRIRGGCFIGVGPGVGGIEQDKRGRWYFGGYSGDELKALHDKRLKQREKKQ